jgi:predicted Ser/Thr protein kinase
VSVPYHNKALAEGSLLREWRLEEVLGVGGFGIVYRGKNVHFGDSVAIKEYFPGAISDRIDGTTVAPSDSSSEEIYQLGRQKFMEEAKILWNLSRPQRHPNLVSVQSLFEIHGTAYMVMDFESGISLSQLMREGKKFDEASLLGIFKPIAEGLERAHKAGVLHRDIKPANILINADGRPVLIDFGSARFESGSATNTKVTFYTPPYAALEQYVKSFPQGPWTDIYALGVVLYQCITGEKPPEVLERMHGEDGALLSSREWPGFSRTFTKAVDAAMKVRPRERPASISAWLKMFDTTNDEPAPLDEPTRIAAPMAALPAELQEAMAAPAAEALKPVAGPGAAPVAGLETTAVTAAAPAAGLKPKAAVEPEKEKKLPVMAIAAAMGMVVLAGAAYFLMPHGSAPQPAAPAAPSVAAAAPAAAPEAAPVAAAADADLPAKMDALIDAARKAQRPDSEITLLTAAKAKLADLSAKGDAEGVTTQARVLARNQIDILSRAEKVAWQSVDPAADPLNTVAENDAVRQLQTAKSDLDAKLKLRSQDAGQSIDNTAASLTAFATFQQALALAMPSFVAAHRKAFDDARTAARGVIDQVTALGAVEKPWFLAAKARLDAYKLRQDNAAQAKTLAGQLDSLAQKVAASNDLTEINDAIAQAKAASQSAAALYAASNAAKL